MYYPKPRRQLERQQVENHPDVEGLAQGISARIGDNSSSDLLPATSSTIPLKLHIDHCGNSEVHTEKVCILIVDNDSLVRETFTTILVEEGYEVQSAASGEEAAQILSQRPFDIMLCDFFMPVQSGLEIIKRTLENYPDMPVILITGNGSVGLAREALRQGASDFITKPCNQGELPIVVERNLTRQVVARKNALRHKMALHISNEGVLDALLSALNTRDTETEGHSERVTAYTIELADKMGLSEEEIYHIERGALLHDIGKIGIPDRILLKPDKLTPEEWVEMKKHPVIGYNMCSEIEMLKKSAQIVLHHHESWNGKGYPSGLSAQEIPLGARIFAIADTLDAMTSDRPYRKGLPFLAAREEIYKYRGIQFDPEMVDIFLSVSDERWQYILSLVYR